MYDDAPEITDEEERELLARLDDEEFKLPPLPPDFISNVLARLGISSEEQDSESVHDKSSSFPTIERQRAKWRREQIYKSITYFLRERLRDIKSLFINIVMFFRIGKTRDFKYKVSQIEDCTLHMKSISINEKWRWIRITVGYKNTTEGDRSELIRLEPDDNMTEKISMLVSLYPPTGELEEEIKREMDKKSGDHAK